EDERVASLQPDDDVAGPAQLDEQRVDLVLPHRVAAGLLADVAEVGVGAGAVERARRDQAVVEDRVGRRDQLERAARHQAGIARPRSDQVDRHEATRAGSCASAAYSSRAVAAPRRRLSSLYDSFGAWIASSARAKPPTTVGIPAAASSATIGIEPPLRCITGAVPVARSIACAARRMAGSVTSQSEGPGRCPGSSAA